MSWRTTLFIIAAACLCAVYIALEPATPPPAPSATEAITASPAEVVSFPIASSTPAPIQKAVVVKPPPTPVQHQAAKLIPAPAPQTPNNEAFRIQNPYSTPPLTGEALNALTRTSLVNILCTVNNSRSVSGSGVIIDGRGVVLTNAHVAQYVVLSEASSDISCLARTGAPAKAVWKLRVLYIPPAWVHQHAPDLGAEQATGTGENDFALLLLAPLDTVPNPPAITPLPYDVREGITFEGDSVILGSYPAGFIGSFVVENNLYPATTFAAVGNLYTFTTNTIDLLSLGGVILAQGGSSGGAVVNDWGRLVGLIVTTSAGNTTSERDLRAITLGHVDRSMRAERNMGLAQFLDDNLLQHTNDFRTQYLQELAQELAAQIPHQ